MDDLRIRRLSTPLAALFLAAALALAAGQARAQDTRHGTIAADNTPVYSGLGPKYYPVLFLKKGASVEVRAVEFDWLRIAPPPGACSYIVVGALTVAADGKSATLVRDEVVRAASAYGPTADKSYKLQCTLKKGDPVQIVAMEGSYAKIVMPPAASLYLAPDALASAAPAPAAPLKSPPVAPAPVAPAAPLFT